MVAGRLLFGWWIQKKKGKRKEEEWKTQFLREPDLQGAPGFLQEVRSLRLIHVLFSLGGKARTELFPRLFSGFHLIHMVIDVFKDVYPSSPKFIKKQSLPFGGKNFFQDDVAGGEAGRDDDLPKLIAFGS